MLSNRWAHQPAASSSSPTCFLQHEIALTSMRMTLGMDLGSEELNAKYGPGLSLVGGFHNEPTAVPLPLPIVLFASGLGLLGVVARRNKSCV